MKCPNCALEIPIRQGKKARYAWCACGTRIYLPTGVRLDNTPIDDVKIIEEVKDDGSKDSITRQIEGDWGIGNARTRASKD